MRKDSVTQHQLKMENITQPTQQSTQATQRFLIEKFSQEQIGENIVCRGHLYHGSNSHPRFVS